MVASKKRATLVFDALRGDPCARVLRMSPGSDGNLYYKMIREAGGLASSRSGLRFTASHPVARHVLTSADFGVVPTGAPRQRATTDDSLIHPLDDAFLRMDPPRHTSLRALVAPGSHQGVAATSMSSWRLWLSTVWTGCPPAALST
ncbi:hypothetical protein GCM10028799_76650 [Kribbella italica]